MTADQIRHIRLTLGLTQTEFGKLFVAKGSPNGVSKNTVSAWEQGTVPRREIRVKLEALWRLVQ